MNEFEVNRSSDFEVLSRVSWFGYLKIIVIKTNVQALILLAISTVAVVIYTNTVNPIDQYLLYIKIIAALIYSTILIYNIVWTRSIKLYHDKNGVWFYGGILPWAKGVNGARWNDIDSASYKTGFVSWLFKSYKIHINHKYTKENEISFPDMFRGDIAAMKINKILSEKNQI